MAAGRVRRAYGAVALVLACLLGFLAPRLQAQNVTVAPVITTVAGTPHAFGYSGDGQPATGADLNAPSGVAVDSAGNLYIVDEVNNVIRKVNASGTITTVAGNYALGYGYSGDGGTATSAQLNDPTGVAVDSAGNIYIADRGNNVIRMVTVATGVITTVAGNGTAGYVDNVAAISAKLNAPTGVAVDSAGNIYIADLFNNVIRKVTVATGVITTVAGNGTGAGTGTGGYSGDNGPATGAELNGPYGVAVDSAGNLYIADYNNTVVRAVNTQSSGVTIAGVAIPAGDIATVAGTPQGFGYSGDGGLATSAELYFPFGVAVDSAGNLYIADSNNTVIREVTAATGTITTVAGNGTVGYSGDNGPATRAELYFPFGVAVDGDGNLYIADTDNTIIRKVNKGPTNFGPVNVGTSSTQNVFLSINTALTLSSVQSSGDYSVQSDSCTLNTSLSPGTICTLSVQFLPSAPGQRWFPLVATDSSSNRYNFGLEGTGIGSALAFTPGIISTVTQSVNRAEGVAVDSAGNLYIPEGGNNIVVMLSASGTMTTVAGGGSSPFCGASTDSLGDGCPATSAELYFAFGVAVDSAGNLYIADSDNNVIREVTAATGIITTVAGTPGAYGYSGDNGPATGANLYTPADVAVDSAGNLYIVDAYNNVIRKVKALGTITTVAGNGTRGYSGDNGPATSAELDLPLGVAVDSGGNLYIADRANSVIRKVAAATGIITTVAGGGTLGISGDNGPATSATLQTPQSVAVDSAGNFYIVAAADLNGTVRKVNALGIITTVAGNGTVGYSGDGGPATYAQFDEPVAVAVDSAGNLYIADHGNGAIRKVNVTTSVLSFGSLNVGETSSPGSVVVSDVGTAPLNFTAAFAFSSNFQSASVGGDCVPPAPPVAGTPLAVGNDCNLGAIFAPLAASNALTSAITVTDDAFDSPQSVSLGGVATASVPNVVGDTEAIASSAITGLGLTVGSVTTASSSGVASGSVISENPTAETVESAGTPVNLVVSSGPVQVAVPNVVGDTQSAATTAITGAGLTVGMVTTAPSGSVASGDVISQNPSATTQVNTGSAVNLVISSGLAQYLLTTAANPVAGGTVSPASGGSYAAGNSVALVATPNAGYALSSWTASPAPVKSPNSASTSVTMSAAPETVTANFVSALVVNPTSVNFMTVYQGLLATKSITLTNIGSKSLTISSITPSGGTAPGDFGEISSCTPYIPSMPGTLKPGQSCAILVGVLAKTFIATATTNLVIIDSAAGSPQSVPLSATVINPQASVSPSSLSFSPLTHGHTSSPLPVTVKTTGNTSLNFTSVTVSNSNFKILSNGCTAPLGATLSCVIDVEFTPGSKGKLTGTLKITDNALSSPQDVSLSGTGE